MAAKGVTATKEPARVLPGSPMRSSKDSGNAECLLPSGAGHDVRSARRGTRTARNMMSGEGCGDRHRIVLKMNLESRPKIR